MSTLARVTAIFGLGLLAFATSTIACGKPSRPQGSPTPGATPKKGGTLHLATFTDLRSLDPAVSFDTETQPYLELLFAGLVDYDPQGNLIGDLAERWERSDDGKTYRFFLRHGVRMQDGNELLADDVKRSVERALAPETSCPGSSFYERLEGLAAYQKKESSELTGVVVESSHVVTFKLVAPDATFLPTLALPFLRPVCRTAGRRYDDNFQLKACGAGPFQLDQWQPGRYLRIKRYDGYFAPERIYLDAIELRMDVSRLTQRFQLERGEIDGILAEWDRPGALYFRTHPEWSKYGHQAVEARVYGDFMNVEMKPFDDVRVRRAVAAALNRPNLQRYYEGWALVTGHMLPPGVPGYDPDFPGQKYDLPRARALMAEAGYPFDPATGKGGYPETITYYSGEGESATRYASILQYDLAQIGVRIEIKETSFPHYQAVAGRPRTITMGYVGWNIDYPDPSDFFEPILSSKAYAEEDSQNKAFYRNPKLDALLDAAHGELDVKKRMSMYREAESIVVDDAPWNFAYYPMRYELTQPWVRDYKPHPIWARYFKHVWIDEGARPTTHALIARHPGEALGSLVIKGRGR